MNTYFVMYCDYHNTATGTTRDSLPVETIENFKRLHSLKKADNRKLCHVKVMSDIDEKKKKREVEV